MVGIQLRQVSVEIMSEIHITRAVYKDTKVPVSIEDVDSGLQDNIVCACCGAKLVANKGQVKAWYFSHYFDEACLFAYETQLHLTAKEYFSKIGKIPMPLEAGWIDARNCAELKISNVQIEVYMDGRRPDLIVNVGSEQYWVEIANKHKCDAEKVWSCRANDKNVIEIDVAACGHLDKFDSLENCVIRVQSLNPCNDYFDEIAAVTAKKHETVRKQFEALRRSQKQLEAKDAEQDKIEKTMEERIAEQKKKHDAKLERMKIRESAQSTMLAELEKAIKANQIVLQETEQRKANLNKIINDEIKKKLVELEVQNQVVLSQLQDELERCWQHEIRDRRQQFEQDLSNEYKRRFQGELNEMEAKRAAHQELEKNIKILEHEQSFLRVELDELVVNKQLIKEQQAKQIEEELSELINKKESYEEKLEILQSTIDEKVVEANLIDTYANNFEDVKRFCIARTDYQDEIHRRMREIESLQDTYSLLEGRLNKTEKELTSMVWLSYEFAKAFKSTFDVLTKKELMESLPNLLTEKLQRVMFSLPRNAYQELEDRG
ncbi:competence protein CoiA family protein [Xanthomarina gelatinilytica]|uniref:competence protein CoiA family protein n=1 Tax=Xanthomarina gelatinilytica TaxID=1137281 RepID=UPI003AA99BE4